MHVRLIPPNSPEGVALPALPHLESLTCEGCAGRYVGICAPLGNNNLASLVAMGVQRNWAKRQLLYDSESLAQTYYKITQGIVVEFMLLADGRRQIVAIRTVGDLCGYPAREGRYFFTGQAITPVIACTFKAEKFNAYMADNVQFACAVADDVSERLNKALISLTVVGQFSAVERVAHFISEMEKRLRSRSIYTSPIALPLTRQEIADYLGLTLETVSRAFSKLKHLRLIALDTSALVTVLDHKRLSKLGWGL